jgi:serine/threonine protein kinase
LKDNNNNNMFTTYQKISSEIACALPHINVVRHYSLCSKNYQEFFLIMEYVPRGALASLLRTSKWVSVDHEFN